MGRSTTWRLLHHDIELIVVKQPERVMFEAKLLRLLPWGQAQTIVEGLLTPEQILVMLHALWYPKLHHTILVHLFGAWNLF
jgi:hypothetical protein